MPKRLLLHIGATKTGSSALQHALFTARDALREAGVHYSERGVVSFAHHLLFAALEPGEVWTIHADRLPADRAAFFRETAAAIRDEAAAHGCDTILLSSEYLWGVFDPPLYAAVRDAFDGLAIELCCFLRRQDEWIVSSYLQAVKHGESRDFRDWYAWVETSDPIGFDYFAVIDRWAKGLAARGVNIAIYGRKARCDVVAAFCDATGLPGVATQIGEKLVNPSPNRRGLELLLAVNRSDLDVADKADLRRAIARSYAARPGAQAVALDPDLHERIIARGRQVNARLKRIYLGGMTTPLFRERG